MIGGKGMSCLFCSIVSGEIPSTKVYEDEWVYAFKDIDPQAPVHIVLIPKEHCANFMELKDMKILSYLGEAAQKICAQEGIDKNGFRVVTNCGEQGGQTVDHLHFHILGGRNLMWPPG